MLKKFFPLVLLMATVLCGAAQNTHRRGVALGADRDSLLYIIASPFDNWHITLGGGVQTFIGNELIASARKNSIDYNLRAEIGKWIIPDVSISLRLGLSSMNGQSTYGRQPFIDKLNSQPNANGYYPFRAHIATLAGIVTFDWTNFLKGYEAGRQTYLHVFTPVGLGGAMLFGSQKSQSPSLLAEGSNPGDFRRNFELFYTVGLGFEYEMSQHISLNLAAELFGSRGSIDWSPYDNSYSNMDLIPSVNLGLRFNLLKNITKYNPYTNTSSVQKVNHEFIAIGSANTIPQLKGTIRHLNMQIDSLQSLSDDRSQHDSATIAQLEAELAQLDSLRMTLPDTGSIFDKLLSSYVQYDIPSTILYFKLNKYDLEASNCSKLQHYASLIQHLGDTTEYYILGAADAETGTPRINERLARRRCQVVYDYLVKQLDINANQLITLPLGGLYGSGDENRMAMIIQKTPRTERIIEHWKQTKQR